MLKLRYLSCEGDRNDSVRRPGKCSARRSSEAPRASLLSNFSQKCICVSAG
jgi:hypothetical protein